MTVDQGSSPHTRGARANNYGAFRRDRIIPAYAGSTDRGWQRKPASGDHPRIRGEHDLMAKWFGKIGGSSPHTRGAHADNLHCREASGIIPACAGSTAMPRSPGAASRDHPRIRGEHIKLTDESETVEGSSPHTRGAQGWMSGMMFSLRIIPAYAGSTRRGCWPRGCRQDHPRIRGEH